MNGTGSNARRAVVGASLALALTLGCAQKGVPPGGPEDKEPPRLVALAPDSGAVLPAGTDVLRFVFSEKMTRQDAYRWLTLYPPLPIRSTKWSGLREAEVRLEEPIPADTVLVVELLASLKDNHNVPWRAGSRRFPVTTLDSLPSGEIRGTLIFEDKPLPKGVVALHAVPPETTTWDRMPVLRRATTDSLGRFRLPWLMAPDGPFLLHAYADNNADLRPGENEPARLLPDTVRLTESDPVVDLDPTILYPLNAPGQLVGQLAGRPRRPGPVLAFTAKIADRDTGWVPEPRRASGPLANTAVPDSGDVVIPNAGPGLVRAIFFVDASGDSLFSAIPDDPADSTGAWVLEPWALVDSLRVAPGLDTPFPPPVWPDTLTTWPSPLDTAAAAPDTAGTLEGAAPDTSGGDGR